MPITVSTLARTRALTTAARVRASAPAIDSSYDTLLGLLIDRATAAIERYCGRTLGFARQVYSDTVAGYGGRDLQLSVGPLISVSSVLQDGTAVTDYSISDRDHGRIYRTDGWQWTPAYARGLSGRQRWPGWQQPIPGTEEPLVVVAHTSGYLLPSDWLTARTTISAAAADNSFNDSGSGFHPLLRAGDTLLVAGFAGAANNGRFRVTGTPTAAKIIVDATLTTEAAGTSVSIDYLSHCEVRGLADVEAACIEIVKTWFADRDESSAIVEKHAGPMGLRYDESTSPDLLALPPLAAGLLRAWKWAA